MSLQLTDYGWRIAYGDCDIINDQLSFLSECAIVREGQPWRDVEVSANFIYKGSDIGVILCYNSMIGYILFSTNTSSCKLSRVPIASDDSTVITLGQERLLATTNLIENLAVDTPYTLKVERSGTNIKCYIDDTLVINTEESLYSTGSIGIYGGSGEISTGVTTQRMFSDSWAPINLRNGDIASRESDTSGNGYIHLQLARDSDSIVGVKQTISTVVGNPYTIQCSYTGDGIDISFGMQEASDVLGEYTTSTIVDTFIATDTSTDIVIGSKSSSSPLLILDVQVEEKSYPTTYVYNDSSTPVSREDASLVYPAEGNIDIQRGSISLWFKPMMDYATIDLSVMPIGIFYYGDDSNNNIRVYYNGSNVIFEYGTLSVSYTIDLDPEEIYHIVAVWDDTQDGIKLFVANKDDIVSVDDMGIQTGQSLPLISVESDIISVGGDPLSRTCNGVIDNLIIYNRALDETDIYMLFTSEEEPENNGNMLLRANFNNGIGNFDWSTIDITPAPLPGTPVIVRKADGTIMRKVSFTDPNTNKYIPYYKQLFTYNGGDKVQISIEDIDYGFFNTGIFTLGGLKIAGLEDIDNTSSGRIVKLLSPLPDQYLGQDLEIWYQPKDCYTVDFNPGEDNVCRITLGKNEGEPVTIIYEANPDVGDYMLAETIDLNTMNNPNNQGFMYITQRVGTTGIFRVNLSPDEFVANGYNYSLIVLEVVDENGNPVSNADYEFTTKRRNSFTGFPVNLDHGFIEPYNSPAYEDYLDRKQAYINLGNSEEQWYEDYGYYIGLNERAGRQIFLYKTKRITPDMVGADEVMEKILVRDKISGLGTELSVRLVIKSDYKLTN